MKHNMRIAIFLNNSMLNNVDYSCVLEGNPGIGGTQYSVVMLVECLRRYYPNCETFLFSMKEVNMGHSHLNCLVESPTDLICQVKEKRCDVLIITSLAFGQELSQSFVEEIERAQIKTIVWGHNFYYKEFCDRIANSNMIKANVFVGKQQYDKYIDHEICSKSTYIYNMYPKHKDVLERNTKKHIVTYIGSLVPSKGFHVLAEQWSVILKTVPDAELYVIGSGKLYNQNATLGKYCIAESGYETSFMKYLTDSNGDILPSVHFMGVMGCEKKKIILETSVGIVNPLGKTETFGISALDFESIGVPVVTIGKGGFLDTVIDGKTGYLYKRAGNLSNRIIDLLLDDEKNKAFGVNGTVLSKTFSPEKIIPMWYEVIRRVYDNMPLEYIEPNNFYFCDLKWLRILVKKFKKVFKIDKGFTIIGVESFVKGLLSRRKG